LFARLITIIVAAQEQQERAQREAATGKKKKKKSFIESSPNAYSPTIDIPTWIPAPYSPNSPHDSPLDTPTSQPRTLHRYENRIRNNHKYWLPATAGGDSEDLGAGEEPGAGAAGRPHFALGRHALDGGLCTLCPPFACDSGCTGKNVSLINNIQIIKSSM